LRVPEHAVVALLLAELNEPILSMTLQLPDDEYPLNDPEDILDRIGNRIDIMLDSGFCGIESTTVVDLSGPVPELIRRGTGDVRQLGLE
jgi:tRNA A37 threonylcarbamoyladenosine synthetase subunit TsaC/SUA5/YrdC